MEIVINVSTLTLSMSEKYKYQLPTRVGAVMLDDWRSDVEQAKSNSSSTRGTALVILLLPGRKGWLLPPASLTSKHGPQNQLAPWS